MCAFIYMNKKTQNLLKLQIFILFSEALSTSFVYNFKIFDIYKDKIAW